MNFASNLVSVLEIEGILLRSKWDVGKEEGYLNGYVTDEQRSRRPILITTLWAGS